MQFFTKKRNKEDSTIKRHVSASEATSFPTRISSWPPLGNGNALSLFLYISRSLRTFDLSILLGMNCLFLFAFICICNVFKIIFSQKKVFKIK